MCLTTLRRARRGPRKQAFLQELLVTGLSKDLTYFDFLDFFFILGRDLALGFTALAGLILW